MDINLINIQSKPIVVSSNTTAENDRVYHVVANATFTDPSPVEGRGFTVFVRNGTATLGGSNFGVQGCVVRRVFHSGSWTNSFHQQSLFSTALDESVANKSTNVNTDQASNAKYPSVKALFDWATALFFPKPTGTTSQYLRGDGSLETFPTIPSIAGLVPETRTINGLDLSENRTLTASDVGAPSGSGTSTGTNTGDETQASILSKLGLFKLNFAPSSIVTGTASETQVGVVVIPPNSIRSIDNLRIMFKGRKVATGLGTALLRMKLSTSNTMPSGATDRIGTFIISSGNRYAPFQRFPDVSASDFTIFDPSNTTQVTEIMIATAPTTLTYDFSQTLYLYFSIELSNTGDQAFLQGGYITNF